MRGVCLFSLLSCCLAASLDPAVEFARFKGLHGKVYESLAEEEGIPVYNERGDLVYLPIPKEEEEAPVERLELEPRLQGPRWKLQQHHLQQLHLRHARPNSQ